MNAPPVYSYQSDIARELERARGRAIQAARRLRCAAQAAEQAGASCDPQVRAAFTTEALRISLTASDSCALADDLIQGAIGLLTGEELDEEAAGDLEPRGHQVGEVAR